MDILAIIPARAGSKGIPNKNIKALCGKPLIHYTIEQALRLNIFKHIVVSTEDNKIKKFAEKLLPPLEYLRPTNLAEDQSPTLPVILHVLEEEEKRGRQYEAVCLLQTTAPLRSDELIVSVIDKMKHNPKLDAVITMKKVPDHFHPNWVFKRQNDLISSYEDKVLTRRQLLDPVYYRDGSVYLTKTDCLKQKKSLFGAHTAMVENNEEAVNLDTMEDWVQAEKIMSKGK